jgi:hypothetical protein
MELMAQQAQPVQLAQLGLPDLTAQLVLQALQVFRVRQVLRDR